MEVFTLDRFKDVCVGVIGGWKQYDTTAAQLGPIFVTHHRHGQGTIEGSSDSLQMIRERPELHERFTHFDHVTVVDDIQELGSGDRVIVGPRGIPIPDRDAALARGVDILGDATCVFVRRQNDAAAQLASEGYDVVMVGEHSYHGNERLTAIISGSGRRFLVVERIDELAPVFEWRRVGVIGQTTGSSTLLQEVVAELARKCKDFKVLNTICGDTVPRTRETEELAKRVDAMVVVGSGPSARRLQEAAAPHCRVFMFPNVNLLDTQELAGFDRVGVVGENNVPRWTIDAAAAKLRDAARSM